MPGTPRSFPEDFMSIIIPTISLSGSPGSVDTTIANGTANTGVTATEYVFDGYHVTQLAFSALAIAAIVGAADEAVGKLLYTLPAGTLVIRSAHMNLGLTATGVLVAADTPDVGLGMVIATGANALLSAVATYENVLTGQTAGNVPQTPAVGTLIIKGVTNQILIVNPLDSHAIHLNLADGWAGADAGLKATGTVLIEWVTMT